MRSTILVLKSALDASSVPETMDVSAVTVPAPSAVENYGTPELRLSLN